MTLDETTKAAIGRSLDFMEMLPAFICGCLAGWIACLLWNFFIIPVWKNVAKRQKGEAS